MGCRIGKIQNKIIKLKIVNTKGQERFDTITKSYYNSKDGIIFLYNVNDRDSFDSIKNRINQIDKNAKTNASKVLVGNISLESSRAIKEEEGKKLANEFNLAYFEISIENNQNIDYFFDYFIDDILKKKYIFQEAKIQLKRIKNNEGKKGCV